MKKAIMCIATMLIMTVGTMDSYSQRRELKANEIPRDVVFVLNEYLKILSTSKTLDECAQNIVKIFGGHLLSSDLSKVSNDVKPWSLKKDWENVKILQGTGGDNPVPADT